MRRIILSYVACLALQYFALHLITGTIFRGRGGVLELKMYVLIACTTYVWNIPHSSNNSARYCHNCLFVLAPTALQWVMASSFTRFLYHTRHATVGRTSLDEWSAVILTHRFWYFADRASQYIYLNINQLDARNFIMSIFHASTCFEHMCSSSGGQNCTIQSLVSSHL